MPESTTVAPVTSTPSDSVCVLVGAGTRNILGGQSFQTYSPDGAKKAATKLEGVHKANNIKLAAILLVPAESRADEQKEFVKEYGESPKPESLEIRTIESLSLGEVVTRNTPKAPVILTNEQKLEKAAKLRAQLAALENETA